MMVKFKFPLTVLVLTLTAIVPSNAAIVFSNNFDSENGGVPAGSYNTFSNLTLVGSNLANLTDIGCASGLCVTAASGSDSVFLLSQSIPFNAFDTILLSFDISGGGGSLPLGRYAFNSGFAFDSNVSYIQAGPRYTAGGGVGTENYGPGVFDTLGVGRASLIDGSAPFSTQSFYLLPSQAGVLQIRIVLYGPPSGPIIDNVRLEITPASVAVPEPSSAVALFLAALAGFARRRLSRLNCV